MGKKKRSKQRTDFRKNSQGRVRKGDLTREFRTGDGDRLADIDQGERVSGKGKLTRKRTVSGVSQDGNAETIQEIMNKERANLEAKSLA